MRDSWLVFLCGLAGCGNGAPGAAITFDPCGSVVVSAAGASDDQLASIDDALALWRAHGVTGVVRGQPADIPIVFRAAAESDYGFYDDTTATIYVNVELTDSAERAITVSHELGHALGLVHVPLDVRGSVMNPGNLTVAPTAEDVAALAAVWGSCPTR